MLIRTHATLLAALLGILLAAAPAALGQTTWYVDDDAPTDPGPGDPTVSDPLEDGSAEHPFDAIQEGIDAADPQCEVLVADGVYTGVGNRELDYAGKAITVISENGPENCIIDCEDSGRGIIFDDGETSDAVLDGFTITGGIGNYGAGVNCTNASNPTVRNSIIAGNHADRGGAGVNCGSDTSPTLINCIIVGNTADMEGGGVRGNESTATLVHCTIVDNNGAYDGHGFGGGVHLEGDSVFVIDNCILSGNTATSGSEARVSDGSVLTISYSDVDGGQGEIDATDGTLNWGDGMIDADPRLADRDGGDYRLTCGSPCVDAGTNTPTGGLPTTDCDGDPRPQDGDGDVEPWTGVAETADMGAYESEPATTPMICCSAEAVRFLAPLGEPNPDDQVLSIWNCGIGALNWEIVEDCDWLTADPLTGDSTGEVDDVMLSADSNGLSEGMYECVLEVVDLAASNSPVTISVKLYVFTPEETVRFVDDDASPGGNGLSWITAHTYLRDALTDTEGTPYVNEIRVAGGVYKPDEGDSVTPNDRTATFQLLNDVTILGGYRGLVGGGDPEDRDITTFETVLSGDIGVADDPNDNSYRVVSASGTDASALLDGVTIAYGCADKSTSDLSGGGGLYVVSGAPTLSNCTIRDNRTWGGDIYNILQDTPGAGVYCDSGSPTFIDCAIHGNRTYDGHHADYVALNPAKRGGDGGGLFFTSSAPLLINCAILDNHTGKGGGGSIYSGNPSGARRGGAGGGVCLTEGSDAIFINCTLSENSTGAGGRGNSVWIEDVEWCHAGAAGGAGAGVHISDATGLFINTVFSGNSTGVGGRGGNTDADDVDGCGGGDGGDGGAVYCADGASVTCAGCLFADNAPGDGGEGGDSEYAAAGDGGDGGSGAAVCAVDSDVVIADCTIARNTGGQGGEPGTGADPGSSGDAGAGAVAGDATSSSQFANCILWENVGAGTAEEQQLIGGAITINYSCVEGWTGGLGGSGNIGTDPVFFDPDGADYHLASGSSCIDAGDNTAVPADEADVDDDGDTTERLPLDLDGQARFMDDPSTADTGVADPPDYPYVVDMGAYEYQSELCFGDLDGDDDIDLSDLATLLGNYGMASGAAYEDGDLDGDGDVDLSDLAALLAVYGTSCS